jgi:hypothetical protein
LHWNHLHFWALLQLETILFFFKILKRNKQSTLLLLIQTPYFLRTQKGKKQNTPPCQPQRVFNFSAILLRKNKNKKIKPPATTCKKK